MKPAKEAKVLRAILAGMDSVGKPVPEREWFYPLAWVLTVFCLLLVFKLEDLGVTSPTISAVLMLFIGMGIGWVVFAGKATRRWSAMRPHLDRESIEKRLAELKS